MATEEKVAEKTIACETRVIYKSKLIVSDRDGQLAVVTEHRKGSPKTGPLHIIRFSDQGHLGAFFDDMVPAE